MTVFITEHSQVQRLAGLKVPVTLAAAAAYSLTSAAAAAPVAGSQYIRVSADVGSFIGIFASSTMGPATSTNGFHIAANSPPELFAISTAQRIMSAST